MSGGRNREFAVLHFPSFLHFFGLQQFIRFPVSGVLGRPLITFDPAHALLQSRVGR